MNQDVATSGEAARASGRLRHLQARILDRWKTRVVEEIPLAQRHDPPALLDGMPVFLNRLADALQAPSSAPVLERDVKALVAQHGALRAGVREYSLEHVVLEYQLLRRVLFEILEEDGQLGPAARDLLLEAIDLGVRSASGEFVRSRLAEEQRAQEELAAANADLQARAEQRAAELMRIEERFRTMVEEVKDYAIFTVDPDGYITTWTAGAERMKGYAPSEAIGKHFSMLYPGDGRVRDEPMEHLRVAAAEGRFRGEGLRVRKNGDHFIADVSLTPLFEHGRLTGFIKVVQDLTERALLMQERDLTRTQAEALRVEAEYRKRFVATITHDLRSPLSAARVAAQMIARAPEDHDKVRTWAHRISDAVDRTDRMISDLLDANQLEAGGRLRLRFERFDLRELATDACDELATRHGGRFVVEAEGDVTGHWSRDGLRRVLDNLLSNAVKYGHPTERITVRVHRVEDRVLLTVHNDGTIIPVEEQMKLFNPYHRTTTAQASEKRGWGLGLTLVKGIVEAHGGMVKVESYPTQGTTFTVDLPVEAQAGG